MEIHYGIIDECSRENQERTVKFIKILINLLEVYQEQELKNWQNPLPKNHATIPFSSFEKQYFNSSETEFFIKIINTLKSGNTENFIGQSGALIDLIKFRLNWVNTPKLDLLKTNFYFEFEKDTVSTLKYILSELLEKGYGEQKSVEINTKKITLKINKLRKEVKKDFNGKVVSCFFRGKVNKRFEYLVKLAKNNEKIGASDLSKTSYQNISTEIDKINERLVTDLELNQNVIKNDGNSGYEIDRDFYNPIFD
jgi:hypothetical protein